MAIAYQLLEPGTAEFLAGSAMPAIIRNGTNFPVVALEFTPASNQLAFWRVDSSLFASGNLTVDVYWYAGTATSGNVDWEGRLAAITADTDTQDVETKTLATANTVTDTHLGTTAKRLHKASITLSNTDSIAAGDSVWIRLSCLATSTITGTVRLDRVEVSYTA